MVRRHLVSIFCILGFSGVVVYGQTFNLNGDEDVFLLPSSSLPKNISDKLTIEFQILPKDISSTQMIVWSKSFWLQLNKDGTIHFTVKTDKGLGSSGKTRSRLYRDVWQHIAGVYDGKEIKIYINGKKESSHSHSGNILPFNNQIYIGNEGKNGGYPYCGQVKNIRILNIAKKTFPVLHVGTSRIDPENDDYGKWYSRLGLPAYQTANYYEYERQVLHTQMPGGMYRIQAGSNGPYTPWTGYDTRRSPEDQPCVNIKKWGTCSLQGKPHLALDHQINVVLDYSEVKRPIIMLNLPMMRSFPHYIREHRENLEQDWLPCDDYRNFEGTIFYYYMVNRGVIPKYIIIGNEPDHYGMNRDADARPGYFAREFVPRYGKYHDAILAAAKELLAKGQIKALPKIGGPAFSYPVNSPNPPFKEDNLVTFLSYKDNAQKCDFISWHLYRSFGIRTRRTIQKELDNTDRVYKTNKRIRKILNRFGLKNAEIFITETSILNLNDPTQVTSFDGCLWLASVIHQALRCIGEDIKFKSIHYHQHFGRLAEYIGGGPSIKTVRTRYMFTFDLYRLLNHLVGKTLVQCSSKYKRLEFSPTISSDGNLTIFVVNKDISHTFKNVKIGFKDFAIDPGKEIEIKIFDSWTLPGRIKTVKITTDKNSGFVYSFPPQTIFLITVYGRKTLNNGFPYNKCDVLIDISNPVGTVTEHFFGSNGGMLSSKVEVRRLDRHLAPGIMETIDKNKKLVEEIKKHIQKVYCRERERNTDFDATAYKYMYNMLKNNKR